MTDHDSHNEVFLERCQEEVDTLLAECKWEEAKVVIKDMRDRGFSHHADILMQALLEAQYVYAEDFRFVPVEEDTDIPFLTPEEDEAPSKFVNSRPAYEQDMLKRLHVTEENREALTTE